LLHGLGTGRRRQSDADEGQRRGRKAGEIARDGPDLDIRKEHNKEPEGQLKGGEADLVIAIGAQRAVGGAEQIVARGENDHGNDDEEQGRESQKNMSKRGKMKHWRLNNGLGQRTHE
jgi:hypothetical protein